MAGPLRRFPLEKEDEIDDSIQLADKPLYIRSKESEVHVGTKIVIKLKNENDIEKIRPIMTSLGESSSDVPFNNTAEVKGIQSICNNSLENGNDLKNDMIHTPQNSANDCDKLLDISRTPEDKSKIASLDSTKTDSSLILKPEVILGVNEQFENVKIADIPSTVTFKTETSTDSIISNNCPVCCAEYKQLKLASPVQSAHSNQYCDGISSVPYQQEGIAIAQNQCPHNFLDNYHKIDCNVNSCCLKESLYHHSAVHIPNASTSNNSDYSLNARASNQTDHTASSVLHGSQLCCLPHRLDNFSNAKTIDESFIKTNEKETHDYWKRLGKNYMEERNFMLWIYPGVFYDTPHGIVVEMKNGCHYEIVLLNNSNEACDVDLYVDTKLVYSIRLDAYDRTMPLDGPVDSEKKFVFLRAWDSPPEAGIIRKHERNGQIKAVFKPELQDMLKEHTLEKANSLEPSGSIIGNIISTFTGMLKIFLNREMFMSGLVESNQFCSGATALQGKQTEKRFKYAKYMNVDENRMVVLQLRLVARIDDESRPSTSNPITPLITEMPPPLSF